MTNPEAHDPSDIFKPETQDQVLDAVHWAFDHEKPLCIEGMGSKRALGAPVTAPAKLDLSNLSGVELYEPAELVITAKAGTPWEEVQALLAQNNQHLNFEPQDLSHLLGGTTSASNASGTLGGIIACNLSGPRRIQTGAARDHILGFSAIGGQATLFKSGGRVMKNVTGFDLSKLMAGSFGTLAIMTEVTLKVMPKPEKTRTVLVFGAEGQAAAGVMSRALGSSFEVSAAAHMPVHVAKRSSVDLVAGASTSVTAIRIEGPGPSVKSRCQSLRDLLGGALDVEELHTTNSLALWRDIRDVTLLPINDGQTVWRLSTAPTAGPGLSSKVLAQLDGESYFDWGGGLVWLALHGDATAQAAIIREAISEVGGHATLIRAPEAQRISLDVFHRQAQALDALQSRIKDAFDPKGLFNPGRVPGLL